MTDTEVYKINDLVVNFTTRTVSRQGQSLNVRGLTFEFLATLICASPGIATYEALAQEIWGGRPVSPETIAQRAKLLRDELNDDARDPQYVALDRGQGYRLIPPVYRIHIGQPGQPSTKYVFGTTIAVVVLLGLMLLGANLVHQSTPASVAVLPFSDLSEDQDQRYLADGIAQELIGQLARLDGLEVASRTASFKFRESDQNIQNIGEQLGVMAMLEGSIQKTEQSIRVSVQLIDVETGYELWAARFDRDLRDIIEIQTDIAKSVAGALGIKLGVGDVNEFRGAGTDNFAAYEAFLREDFQRAVELDPNYAAAWGRLGLEVASSMYKHLPQEAPDIINRAVGYSARAIALDPNSAEAHADFATQIYVTLDWHRAQQNYERAMELSRSAYVLYHYSNMLMRAGKSDEAARLQKEAEELERLPVRANLLRIDVDLALLRWEDAEDKTMQLSEHIQPFPRWLIALNKGSLQGVLQAMADAPELGIASRELLVPMLARMHDRNEALSYLRDLAENEDILWPSKFQLIALLAAYFDEPEFAWSVFQQDVRHTTIRYGTLWFPVMSGVRALPEFKQFLLDVKLVNYWRQHGWPDHCWPVGAEDFTCKKMAIGESR